MRRVAQDPAGSISVLLRTCNGRVIGVDLASSRRTDLARRLFVGRPVEHLLSTLPLIYSICATAQASAAVQACENAVAYELPREHKDARELLVLSETAREHLFRIMAGWSRWLQATPHAKGLRTLGEMRAAWGGALYPAGDAFRVGGGALKPDRTVLASLLEDLNALVAWVLGGDVEGWVDRIADADALLAWSASGDSVAQRMLSGVREQGLSGLGASTVDVLPHITDAEFHARLGSDNAVDFVAAPDWEGRPRETGAYERERPRPLLAALWEDHRNGLLPRLAARLTELAETAGRINRLAGALVQTARGEPGVTLHGHGLAQLNAARGRLVHRACLLDGVVEDYCILAPTEWNFHPQGALVQGLFGLQANERLPQLASLLVDAIDPCVDAAVEVIEEQ